MKGYYLFAPIEPECAGPDSGVERKVRAQHRALEEFVDCALVVLPVTEYSGSAAEKIVRRLPFTAAWRKWEYHGEFDGADFLYIRQVYHDDSFTRYLRTIKRANPNIKIVYEIPTYPYDGETHVSLSNVSFLAKERICRKAAAKYLDRIVTFYGQQQIWGVPCIDLINGYDFAAVQLPERATSETVHLLSVSATAFWHGYDRVIEGLHQYYAAGGTENIEYHLVGNILPEHQSMVERYGLQECVLLHGRMSGAPLADMYRKCLLGIDILGGHRKDYPVSSTLKSREYGAYGLPLITSSPVDYLPEDYPYQLLAPYDDSPLDIQAVLDFYHRVYDEKDCNEVARQIRAYAQARCNMCVSMKPVAEYLLHK